MEPSAVDAPADVGDRTHRGDEAQDGEAERGLARARFADDAERLAGAQLERQAVHRLDVVDGAAQQAALDRKPDLEVVGLDDDGRGQVLGRRLALGLGRQQLARIGVLGRLEDVGGQALLDDLALVHDVDAVGHLAHDAEVVRDPQHGHVHLVLQALQQLEDLRLDGDVERGGRLVGDQQVGLVGERHGDHDALALAARELMRKGLQALLGHRECRPSPAGRARAPSRPASERPRCSFSISPTCFSMVCSGLSEVIGSWKMIEILSPRISRIVGLGDLQQVAALEKDLAGRVMRGRDRATGA